MTVMTVDENANSAVREGQLFKHQRRGGDTRTMTAVAFKCLCKEDPGANRQEHNKREEHYTQRLVALELRPL